MENNKEKSGGFFKRYGYYILAFVLILGVTLCVAFSGNENTNVDIPNTDVETETKPLVFGLPVNSPEVTKWYSDTELMFNQTLNQWESHMAIDMVSGNENDLNVYSVLDGIVTNIETSYDYGTIVTVTHQDGFVSKYSSLNENLNVELNQNVSKGTLLGTVSTSATNEIKEGNHLHFALYKDGQKVDPANYLTLENK